MPFHAVVDWRLTLHSGTADTTQRDSCSDTDSSSSDDEKLLAIDSETAQKKNAIPANNAKNQSETRIELKQSNQSQRAIQGPGDEVAG